MTITEVKQLLGVPKRYLNAALTDWPCKTPEAEKSVYIHGGTGLGKTHMLAALMDGVLQKHRLHKAGNWEFEALLWRDGRLPPALFVSTAGLINEIKESFSHPRRSVLPAQKYSKVPFLFLDDLGATLPTEWVTTVLDSIIDARWGMERHLAVSSNLSPAVLHERLGSDRIASRIAGICQLTYQMRHSTGDRRL